MVKIKVCGITNIDDALAAVSFGAHAIGFIFYEKSPRYIKPDDVKEIIKQLPPLICAVGVFVNENREKIRDMAFELGLSAVQLHGDESKEDCLVFPRVIKAVRVKDESSLKEMEEYKVSAFLLDTYKKDLYGGTGKSFNWNVAKEAMKYGNIILSGGLSPDNVKDALQIVKPYSVDVNSGVESSKGVKDHQKLRRFIEIVKAV